MKDKTFLDTNVLIYSYDERSPEKRIKSQEIIFEGTGKGNMVLSTQVLSEFFNIVTKKIRPALSSQKAKEEIQSFSFLELVEIDFPMVNQAIEIHMRYQISYWDALIISSAIRGNCNQLFTEDLNPGQKYEGVLVVNPYQ